MTSKLNIEEKKFIIVSFKSTTVGYSSISQHYSGSDTCT